MQQLIEYHEAQATHELIYESKNVTVYPNDQEGDDSNELNSQQGETQDVKYFTIKTMKVDWEGDNDCIMHIFIDNTDIIKLEEANNSIR